MSATTETKLSRGNISSRKRLSTQTLGIPIFWMAASWSGRQVLILALTWRRILRTLLGRRKWSSLCLQPKSKRSLLDYISESMINGIGISAAKFLVCTLLVPPATQERTYRFVGGNYSWTTIFSTLEKIQGVKWTVTQKSVDEARANQKRVSVSRF